MNLKLLNKILVGIVLGLLVLFLLQRRQNSNLELENSILHNENKVRGDSIRMFNNSLIINNLEKNKIREQKDSINTNYIELSVRHSNTKKELKFIKDKYKGLEQDSLLTLLKERYEKDNGVGSFNIQ